MVEAASAAGRIRSNQPEDLLAMLLSGLAVDRNQQGHGLAAALLKHFLLKALDVAELTGLRVVLVHAKNNQVADFYRRFGFQSATVDDLTLMMLIQDIRETIEA
ncbi:MAG: GNAT family N-acetyltransferase [Chloroflexi bacterium]|nr:GNAT family N-acetyltransferase [Chloroflexota bacterium]